MIRGPTPSNIRGMNFQLCFPQCFETCCNHTYLTLPEVREITRIRGKNIQSIACLLTCIIALRLLLMTPSSTMNGVCWTLVIWVCIDTDHCTREFYAHQDWCQWCNTGIDIYSGWWISCGRPRQGGLNVASGGQETSGKDSNSKLCQLCHCIEEWQMDCCRDIQRTVCVGCTNVQTILQTRGGELCQCSRFLARLHQ